jgi:uncharacterized membrane protein
MTKQEFLTRLEEELSGLPQEDVAERLVFYGEMLEDRMEEGAAEEEAVAGIGPVDAVAKQIIDEIPISKLVRERIKPKRRMGAGEIILLILGSPIWLSLLIAAFAVILSVYIVIWAVIISLWAVFAAFVVCVPAAAVVAMYLMLKGSTLQGIAMIGAAVMLAGLSVFLFFGCRILSKGAVFLTKKFFYWIKSLFIRKEKAQ